MRILRCDMCKKDVIPPKQWCQWRIEGSNQDPTHYELCTDCSNEIRKAIKNAGVAERQTPRT